MTSFLTSEKRKAAFEQLGKYLVSPDDALKEQIRTANHHNSWFTPEETAKAVSSIGRMLNLEDLDKWLNFEDSKNSAAKKIGLILAGNIPMVGFHDILCVLATGHIALIKPSSQDQKLIPFILQKLIQIEPDFSKAIQLVDRLVGFDAVIATGSNNTSRYFEHYFGKVPHIIRKNRNSVAILTGQENSNTLQLLGKDIFDYYGLGCRNVSKLFVPKGYEFHPFFEAIEVYGRVSDNHKYSNNYDYNKSIFLVNGDKHLDNGFLLLKEDQKLASPLAVLYYEEYENLAVLEKHLADINEQIQCVVTLATLNLPNQVGFGDSQNPKLWDYADGINTVEFLLSLQ